MKERSGVCSDSTVATQLTLTCSKSTIQTLENGVKYTIKTPDRSY